ncbi:DNA polymerase III polC-type [Dermatophilus congolensis]|uniref:DNA polymerase III polC-type n=1 Tax=Dermatophilus congolensis TaxID=1863 RepID=A0A239VPY2_9MICO|nr:DEDD exonuclease domain-containing protein [Dermatophilus congolensis]SNV23820.1 DNA polymerase III polC-type [Dermatophilus congolensis]
MHAIQGTLDELGTPLSQVTFVVVDLETTGSNAASGRITEIGAVKICGGEITGEFQTLVNPTIPIPPFIAVLTGITDAMVAQAPEEHTAVPAFLEFAADAVLVAHNAPFDIGFLKAATERLNLTWGNNHVVDTLPLARKLVSRDEAPNHKLGTLAHLFSTETTPNHRALDDAKATVDVLHALIARAAGHGVTTLEELDTFSTAVTPAQQRKRNLADNLPSAPGVYIFKDNSDRVLYVGTSVDIRRRVRSYFTSSENRSRIRDMINIATCVTPIVCHTILEAQVRELRLIAEHNPHYNRRSTRPHNAPWVKLTNEPFPRLSIVRSVRDDAATYAGPFSSHQRARDALDALNDSLPLRRCTDRLSPTRHTDRCALADIGRCGAPCDGSQSHADYSRIAADARAALRGDATAVADKLSHHMVTLSLCERFEDAATTRDRAHALMRGAQRAQEALTLAAIPHIVAGRRRPTGGWEFACIRHGHVAGTTVSPPRADPTPYIEAMVATAAHIPAPTNGLGSALAEEITIILHWLTTEGTRLVEVEGTWTCPVGGAGAHVHRFIEHVG